MAAEEQQPALAPGPAGAPWRYAAIEFAPTAVLMFVVVTVVRWPRWPCSG
ncbi:hypothetical protein ACODT3_06040 [Streptomyces sp. 4.24]